MDQSPSQPAVLFVLDTLARTDAVRMVLTLAGALRRRQGTVPISAVVRRNGDCPPGSAQREGQSPFSKRPEKGDSPSAVVRRNGDCPPGGAQREGQSPFSKRPEKGDSPHPVIACLGRLGELADQALAARLDLHVGLLHHRLDCKVVRRLRRIFAGDIALAGGRSRLVPNEPPGTLHVRRGPISAVVLVEPERTGMFWASLARGRRRLGRPGDPALIAWSWATPRPGRRIVGPLDRLLLGRLNALAVPSPAHARAWADLERIPAGRIHVVPDGLAVEELARLGDRSERADLRAELGATAADVVVMCPADGPAEAADLFCEAAGRLLAGAHAAHPRPRGTGFQPVIEVSNRGASRLEPLHGQDAHATFQDEPIFGPPIRALPERAGRMRFWLVGGGPDRDRTARRVERLGLRRPGFVWLADRDDPAGLWPAADVGVRYAEGQGSDVTALEAMAAGVALIAADAPQDLGSVVQPERTGLLVPPGSLDALVHAIGRLACDWPLRRRLGAAAALHVRDHHSDDHMAAAFERMVRSVLAPEPPFG